MQGHAILAASALSGLALSGSVVALDMAAFPFQEVCKGLLVVCTSMLAQACSCSRADMLPLESGKSFVPFFWELKFCSQQLAPVPAF